MNVHEPGSTVTIGDGIRAKILAARIMAGGYVDYTVAWWEAGCRYECTMEAFEITSGINDVEIGFHAAGKGEDG